MVFSKTKIVYIKFVKFAVKRHYNFINLHENCIFSNFRSI